MLYCQLKSRAKVIIGQTLHLGDVATLSGGDQKAAKICIACPNQPGVWKIDAIACAAALQGAYPAETITMLGPDTCYVHRDPAATRDWSKPLRAAAAFAILLLGSALGMAWFHSDVDMPEAQQSVYRLITGKEVSDGRLIGIPYVIGVTLGVAVFYALPSRKATTPLEVKLTTYQENMDKTEGKDVRDAP